MMKIVTLTVGQMGTNCYLVYDEDTSRCIIIDPGEDADFITTTILENKLSPQAILLTHGHYDHCLAVLDLKLNFDLPIYLHEKDLFLYKNAQKSAHFWFPVSPVKGRSPASGGERGLNLQLPPIDHFLADQEIISFGQSFLQVIHTPGHTPGSVCFISPVKGRNGTAERDLNLSLFTGDTLFADGVGRTDLSYSSSEDLQKSLQILHELPDATLIYPGHGETIVPLSSYTRIDSFSLS